MRLIIFHGSGIAAMNERVLELKKKFDPASIIEVDKGTKDNYLQIRSAPLFSQDRLLILSEIVILDSDDPNLTILLKLPTLSASDLGRLSKYHPQVVSFPEEKEVSVFPWLDKLAQKDRSALANWEEIFNTYGSQYIFSMLIYLLRRNIFSKSKYPSMVEKLSKQKINFPLGRVRGYYLKILETDYLIKSGLGDEKEQTFYLLESFLH